MATYLLSRIFPGSELEALAAPAGRLRKVGFLAGSHDPERLSSPPRFLKPPDFEASENREPVPLGAGLFESEPREGERLKSELLESESREEEPRESELREPEPLYSELLESELREAEPREEEPLESESREERRTAASRLEADAPLDRSVPLPDDRVADPLEPVPLDEPSASVLPAAEPLGLELLEEELLEVVPLAGRRTGESGFE